MVKSTSAKSVIPRLNAIFARQGIPNELKTDNGPELRTRPCSVIPPNLKAEGDHREQVELEDFRAEQVVHPDPQMQMTAACVGYRRPQRGFQITFK